MRQVFLLSSEPVQDFQNQDGFPVSEKLWPELTAAFLSYRTEAPDVFRIPASAALKFLSDFYARYELSQPQRRILRRLEQILGALLPGQLAGFIFAEVSEHRSRRFAKKAEKI